MDHEGGSREVGHLYQIEFARSLSFYLLYIALE